MTEKEKKETYVRVRDLKGNEFICAIDALKDIKHTTDEELTDCVDDATVGRYAGNMEIPGKKG